MTRIREEEECSSSSKLVSSRAMHASDVGIETLAIFISRRCDLFRLSAVFRRCRRRRRHPLVDRLPPGGDLLHELVTGLRLDPDHRRRERCLSDHWRFSLNRDQHDILPHRQSQLSDLIIRLHITTSLKSISQKR